MPSVVVRVCVHGAGVGVSGGRSWFCCSSGSRSLRIDRRRHREEGVRRDLQSALRGNTTAAGIQRGGRGCDWWLAGVCVCDRVATSVLLPPTAGVAQTWDSRRTEVRCKSSVRVAPAAHGAASHLTPAVALTACFHTSHTHWNQLGRRVSEDVGFVATAELLRVLSCHVLCVCVCGFFSAHCSV